MTPAVAAELCRELIIEHGLQGWTFQWSNSRLICGMCWFKRKVIELSRYAVSYFKVHHVVDTIKHEIAHALAFERHNHKGHGPEWQQICQEIGAKAEPTFTLKQLASEGYFNWELRHGETDEFVRGYHRRPRRDINTLRIKGQPDTMGKLVLVKTQKKRLIHQKMKL